MDDELKSLETELKRLRPRVPSAELQSRVATELALRRRATWAWAALPLAAALAVMLALQFRPASEMAAPTLVPKPAVVENPAPAETLAVTDSPVLYKPVAAEKVLYDSRDDGIITLANGSQARRVRNSYVDTITWRHPETNASVRWSVPRNEVRVVPVSFQ